MSDKVYKDVSVQEVEGGYLVHIDGQAHVCISLGKAIKLIKDHLDPKKGS